MMRMHTVLRMWPALAICLAGLVAATAAHAQNDMRIGVVNVPRILEQSPQYREIMENLETEFADRQRRLDQQRRALEDKAEQLQRDGPVMGADERQNLERQIRDEQRDFQRAVNVFEEDANLRYNEEINNLQRIVLNEIQSFARNGGYDLILANVVYAADAVDVTAQVLESLQASHARGR
jgi:outer membrane protein